MILDGAWRRVTPVMINHQTQVRTQLRKLKGDRSTQKKFDKKYGGMFERGEVYAADEVVPPAA